MIRVVVGALASQSPEGLVTPVRSDLAPLTSGARDVLAKLGDGVEKLQQMGALPVGGAFITPGGELDASFVIAVVMSSEDEPETPLNVQRGLRNALRRAVDWGLASLAVPPLGVGVGHLGAEEEARAMVEILVNHLDEGHPPLDLTIVAGGEYEAEVFGRIVSELSKDRFPMRN